MSERITISEMEAEMLRVAKELSDGLTTRELAERCGVSPAYADRQIAKWFQEGRIITGRKAVVNRCGISQLRPCYKLLPAGNAKGGKE